MGCSLRVGAFIDKTIDREPYTDADVHWTCTNIDPRVTLTSARYA